MPAAAWEVSTPCALPVLVPVWSETASERSGVDVRTILTEVGERRLVGGQEDMIVDIAFDVAAAQSS